MFVVVEALDAGGSSTQAEQLTRKLKREKYSPLSLHFPQEDKAVGRIIYDKLLFSNKMGELTRREQAIFYIQDFYSRSEDIKEHLKGKKNAVVLDRFYTSTLAYQTIGLSGVNRKEMMRWLTWLCEEDKPALPKPDLVIFLDTPVSVSLKRLSKKKKDYFENRVKLTAIRNSYLRVAKEQNWVVLDSVDEEGNEKTRSALAKEVWEVVEGAL